MDHACGLVPAGRLRGPVIDSARGKCYHDINRLIMVRTQIQLTESQSKRLKEAAARKGISVAELIRRGVEIALEQESAPSTEELYRRAIQAAGRFRSSKRDVSRRHDEYLGEAFGK
jgi:hypothetical protein